MNDEMTKQVETKRVETKRVEMTPGPWEFGQESVDPEWFIVTAGGGSIIANVNANQRQEANARAIAALPDVLEALQAAVNSIRALDEDYEERQSYVRGLEALKKAGVAL